MEMGKAILGDILQSPPGEVLLGDEEGRDEAGNLPPSGDGGSSPDLVLDRPPQEELPDAARNASTRRFMVEHAGGIQRLREAAKRPSIRLGFGGLTMNGFLVILSAIADDIEDAKQHVRLCIEAIERYPGLCRVGGFHIIFVFLTYFLASIDDRERYVLVTSLYKSTLKHDALAVPAMEERLRTSICDHLPCRLLEQVIRRSHPERVLCPHGEIEAPEKVNIEEPRPDSTEGDPGYPVDDATGLDSAFTEVFPGESGLGAVLTEDPVVCGIIDEEDWLYASDALRL